MSFLQKSFKKKEREGGGSYCPLPIFCVWKKMALHANISFGALLPFRVIGHLRSWAQRLSFRIPLCSRKAGMYVAKLFIKSIRHAEEEQTIILKNVMPALYYHCSPSCLGKGFAQFLCEQYKSTACLVQERTVEHNWGPSPFFSYSLKCIECCLKYCCIIICGTIFKVNQLFGFYSASLIYKKKKRPYSCTCPSKLYQNICMHRSWMDKP